MYVGYAVAALAVAQRLGLGWRQGALLLLPLVALEGLLRLYIGQRLPRLEQRLMGLLQAGKNDELLQLLRGERLLWFAAPRHVLQAKLAMIYRQLGRPHAAADAFRQALEEAPAAQSYALAVGLGDSLYEIGEDREAERVYRSALDEEHANARACANLARLILRRGGNLDEAELYLRRAVDEQRGGRLRCELIELLLQRGKLEEARWQLEMAGEELAAGSAEDRAALEAARQKVEGSRESSVES